MTDRPRTEDSHGAMGIIASLRSALGAGTAETVEHALGRLDTLETALDRVLEEHSGMGDELLQAYEHLGVVFEVTRKLPLVREEAEVLRLFVESLRPSYPHCHVTTVKGESDGSLAASGGGLILAPWVRANLAACRDEHRVVVAQHPLGEAPDPDAPAVGLSVDCDPQETVDFAWIVCTPIYAREDFVCALLLGHEPADGSLAEPSPFHAGDMLLLESLGTFCGHLIGNVRLLDELRQLSVDVIRTLISTVEQKDEYTSGHSTRVGHLAKLLGAELGLNADALQMLEWSALLHDIGKIGIRDDVLKKPGKLTQEEYEHIMEHPQRSYDVVRGIPQLAGALDGVLYHHEHWGGLGYPDGLVGEEIPLQARIIQISDIFDALTSTRSYRKAFDWEKALSIIQEEAGTTVDPRLAQIFDHLIRRMAKEEPEAFTQMMGRAAFGEGSKEAALGTTEPADGDA